MALDDLASSLALVKVFKADLWDSGDHYSDAIDTAGYRQAVVLMSTGAVKRNASVTVHIDESSDAGVSDPWEHIDEAALPVVTQENDTESFIGRINLDRRKRYIRLHAIIDQHDTFMGVCVMAQPYDTGNSTPFNFTC